MEYYDPLNARLVLPFQRPRDRRSTLPILPSLPQLGLRHFLRATLSRSISSANRATARHEFSIPALRSLASGRWVRGLHRNTNACPPALERLLIAEMRSKLTVALTHAATFGPDIAA